jgi:hypothetical protein
MIVYLRSATCLYVLFLVFSIPSVTATVPVVVIGQVEDESGRPIATATVRLLSADVPLGLAPEAVDFAGRFQVIHDVDSLDRLTCEIQAPGFESQVRNIVPAQGKGDLGELRLKRRLTLQVDALALNSTADDKFSILDLLLENKAKQNMGIVEETLRGTAKGQTNCADESPTVEVDLGDKLSQAQIKERSSGFADDFAVNGRVDFLPCQQTRIDLHIRSLISFKSGETIRLRLAIPQVLKSGANQESRRIALSDWTSLNLTLALSDHSTIEAPVK